MKWIAWFSLVAIGIVSAWGLWWAWNDRSAVVEVATVSRGSLDDSLQVVGVARATRRSVITAPVSGMLSPILLTSGDELIESETVLATLTAAPPPLLDARARAVITAQLAVAEAELARSEELRAAAQSALESVQKRKTPTTSSAGAAAPAAQTATAAEEQAKQQALKAAKTNEERAQLEVNAIRAQLEPSQSRSSPSTSEDRTDETQATDEKVAPLTERFEIRAPIDGHVLSILRAEPGLIGAGVPIMEIGDLQNLDFTFEVLSTEAAKLTPQMSVQISGWGPDEASLPGQIKSIERSAVRAISALGVEEQRVRIHVVSQTNATSHTTLGDGFRVHGRIQLRQRNDVLKVPLGALFRKEGAWFVFRVQAGRAVLTEVELGLQNESEAAVVSGLDDHDLVILYPADRIQHEQRVEIR